MQVEHAAIGHLVGVLEMALAVERDRVDKDRTVGSNLLEPEGLSGATVDGAADGERIAFACACRQQKEAGAENDVDSESHIH